MILDERSEFADSVNINTGPAGIYNIGDVIDRAGPPQWPNAAPALDLNLYLVVMVSADFTGGGTAAFRLVSDDTSVPSTSAATVHFTSGAFTAAQATKGRMLFAWPMSAAAAKRYLGVQQITAGTAFFGGAIDIFMTDDFSSLGRVYAKAAQ